MPHLQVSAHALRRRGNLHQQPLVSDGRRRAVLLQQDEDRATAEQYASQREIYDRAYAGKSGYRLDLWQIAYVERLERNLGWTAARAGALSTSAWAATATWSSKPPGGARLRSAATCR